jgi:hypothetical protein
VNAASAFPVKSWRALTGTLPCSCGTTSRRTGTGALETLLAYNILDAVNLETLMVCAYNLKIKDTPFGETHQLPMPTVPRNPFDPDVKTMRRIADQYYVNE